MSELGQNEGQEQNEKATFFDSAKISEKKDVEHFSNVEGAEERAKAAERARKAAEKEAAEVHAADVRAAAEQMKKAENKQAGKKGGILGFLFGGWHKIVTIVMVLALVAGCTIVPFMLKSKAENERLAKDDEMQVAALDVYREVSDIQQNESLDAALEKMENEIKVAPEEKKIYLLIYYAEFLATRTGDTISAKEKLFEAKEYCKNDKERDAVRNAYVNIGMILNDSDFASGYDSVEEKK